MPKKPDIFIGIDPSLRATGIIVLNEKEKIRYEGLLCTKQKDIDRLLFLRERLTTELTTLNKENNIKLICIENYSFASKGMQFSIGEMGGIYKLVMKDLNLPFTVVAPTILKKYVTGKGNCKKDLILKEVYKKYGIDFNDDNLADAFGLALIAYKISNKDKMNKTEKEALKTLL